MTIKSILCVFGGAPQEMNALRAAFVLSETYGARLRVLHVSPDPDAHAGIYSEMVLISGEIAATIKKENLARMEKARGRVAAMAAERRLPLDAADAPAHHASVRFVHVTGMVETAIAREGRLSDLIVLARECEPSCDALTPALFTTGRPALVIPPAGEPYAQWRDKTVALAWNGSLEAARALYNALPLLKRTETLYALTVEKRGDAHDLEEEAALIAYLRAHGVAARGVIVAGRNDQSAGEALLARARELNADLLVMGAYGHSLFREMVLGGVTEHMLRKSDIPLLLSH